MGKVGKAKKARNKAVHTLLKKTGNTVIGSGLITVESDTDESDADIDPSESLSRDLSASVRVLNIVGQRTDIYESKSMKQLRTILFPLIEIQISKGSHFELSSATNPVSDSDCGLELGTRRIAALSRTAAVFMGDREAFFASDAKQFRAALHPLVLLQLRRKSGSGEILEIINQSHSARVSSAFRSRDWPLALKELYAMHHSKEYPKLGALQRWVRECDFALQHNITDSTSSDEVNNSNLIARKNTSLLLLDAVMRVALTKEVPTASDENLQNALPSTAIVHHYLTTFKSDPNLTGVVDRALCTIISDNFGPRFLNEKVKVLSHVPGALRRPPSDTDLNIFTVAPDTITFSSIHPPLQRLDVEKVAGTFLIQNVLSSNECLQFIAAAEAIGYSHDAVAGIDNIVLYADDSLLLPIFERCRHLLPQEGLEGINARFRFFRYRQGAVYRPHIDGSWPGSGLVDGEYVDDAFCGKKNSKLTFLLYLNGDSDFEGGSTTFFVPGKDKGHIEARAVHPQRGAVLVFPHGTVSSPVHEGSEISDGSHKYVIRTDVLYSTTDLANI